MFSSIQSIPGLIFARSDVKAKIRPGVEARGAQAPLAPTWTPGLNHSLVGCTYTIVHKDSDTMILMSTTMQQYKIIQL